MAENVVISGISGKFPECANIDIFAERLLAGECLISFDDERWPKDTYNLPQGSGKLRDIDKFDAEYFKYADNDADVLDPMTRLLTEETYSAICDAGINPKQLSGSNTGFFYGAWTDEVEAGLRNDIDRKENIFAFHASRVSHAFNFHGPTCYLDNACAGSLTALQIAVNSIQNNLCDQAIVGGVNITLNPIRSAWQNSLKTLASDSVCRVWDIDANGYVKGESCVALVLQKKSAAKRIHAEILGIKINIDGYKDKGFTFPGWKTQRDVMVEAMSAAGIDGNSFSYLEAHGTGTPAGDPVEIKSISEAICKTRNKPLLIGSIKSNIGHTEGASGVSSLAKIIIAYQRHEMPPNLNYSQPNPKIPQLFDNSIVVCDKRTPFNGGIVGINNFGVGGGNGHLVIKSNTKTLTQQSYQICEPLPRLIVFYGRREELVDSTLNKLKSNAENLTQEYLALLNDLTNVAPEEGMNSRGFIILDQNKQCVCKMIDKTKERPIWYTFPGLGCQWQSMAKSMMNFNIFAKSFHRSVNYLRSLGADADDVVKYLLNDNDLDINNSKPKPIFMSIVVIQIALVDLLSHLGVQPNGIVGHSIGEIVAAYADQCFTAEDALKISYALHQQLMLSDKSILPTGVMAAVGLSWSEAQSRCFGSVSVACNNSPNMVTMSGNNQDMNTLIEKLKTEKIFAQKVENHGIAAHSPLMASIKKNLFAAMKKLNIKPNKRRSKRWLSTSFAENEWHDQSCERPDGEYYARNLTKPVLYYECITKAPEKTLFVEIGPNGLFRSSIRKSFSADSDIQYLQMMKKDNGYENVTLTLSTIGQLYMNGQNVSIKKLYPGIQYPVPHETAFISPLIQWDHRKTRFVPKFPAYFSSNKNLSVYEESISVSNDDYKYLCDHAVDGRVLFPATGYLYLAWKTLALSSGFAQFDQMAVEFVNVNLYRATKLSNDVTIFKCHYFKDSAKFAIEANGMVCAEGSIYRLNRDIKLKSQFTAEPNHSQLILSGADFYKELRIRGYDYGPQFRGVVEMADDGQHSRVKWTGNVISFLDSILQLTIWLKIKRFLCVPTHIESLSINFDDLCGKYLSESNHEFTVDVIHDLDTREIIADGIRIKNIVETAIARKIEDNCLIESYDLVAYDETNAIDEQLKNIIFDYCNACENATNKANVKIVINSIDNNNNRNNFDVDDSNTDYNELNANEFSVKHETECHGLLNFIHSNVDYENDKNNNFTLNSKQLEKYGKEFDNDLIHSTILSNRFLKPQLDVIVENVDTNRIVSMLEVNSSHQIFYQTISKLILQTLTGFSLQNLKYTIAHSDKNALNEDVLNSAHLNFVHFDTHKTRIPYREINTQNIVIYRDPKISLSQISMVLDYDILLRSLHTTLADGGFLLAFLRESIHSAEERLIRCNSSVFKHDVEKFVKHAENAGFICISRKSDAFTCCAILFRKVNQSPIRDIKLEIQNSCLNWLEPLKQALNNDDYDRIWLTSSETLSGITGLVRGLRNEKNGTKIRSILYDKQQITADKAYTLAKQTDLVQNVFRDNIWGSYRHFTLPDECPSVQTNSAQLIQTKLGDLTSFKWHHLPINMRNDSHQRDQQILIDIFYCPLNFKDVMHATGKLPPFDLTSSMAWDDVVLGLEFVGRVRDTGERVMGLNLSKGLSTSINASKHFLWSIPSHWSMTDAATVPCVYATAYYALIIRAKLKPRETVLIHSGSGGVGQACINICLSMSCKVFTTVGSNEKRAWIKKHFPRITDHYICNSRDASFETNIMQMTGGRGVDIVVNSLTDEMFWASLRCLANNGRFCELGKYQFLNNDAMDISLLLKNKSFHGIYLDALFDLEKDKKPNLKAESHRRQMWKLLNDGIYCGIVKPLTRTVYKVRDTEKAFRLMASGKHIGKVIIEIRDEDTIRSAVKSSVLTMKAIPRTYFQPNKSYIITGGLGGMGLELMYWMYERGARYFVLTSRSGVKTQTQQFAINRLRALNCQIVILTDNGSVIDGALKIINKSRNLCPIGGIFLLTLVLDDDLVENQTVEKFTRVMRAKSDQAVIFDRLTRELSTPLDYFVGFSSASSGRGIEGQTNYAFANSILEMVCRGRRRDGLHGVAVQWGVIADVGYVADIFEQHVNRGNKTLHGYIPQRLMSCWAQLDRFMQSEHCVCASMVRAEDETQYETKVSLLESICNIMGMKNVWSVDQRSKLGELGLDSLMAIEIKTILDRDYHSQMSAKQIRNITIQELIQNFQ